MKKQIKQIRIEKEWLNYWLMFGSMELTTAEGSLENAIKRLLNLLEIEGRPEETNLLIDKVSTAYDQILEIHKSLKTVRNSLAENPQK